MRLLTLIYWYFKKTQNTHVAIMHSSRMRTVRCSGRRGVGGLYASMHWAGWCLLRGCVPGGEGEVSAQVGLSDWGCLPRGGVCLGGVCLGVSAQGNVFQTPPSPP